MGDIIRRPGINDARPPLLLGFINTYMVGSFPGPDGISAGCDLLYNAVQDGGACRTAMTAEVVAAPVGGADDEVISIAQALDFVRIRCIAFRGDRVVHD